MALRPRLAALLGALIVALAAAGPAGAATHRFSAAADATVRADVPDTTHGSQSTLRVDSSPRARAYLRFNVAGLTRSVRRATLRLYTRSGAGDYGIELRDTGAFAESTLTYANAPPVGVPVARTGAFGTGQWISLDATSLVRANGAVHVALATSSSTARLLASREDAAYRPQLVVEERPHLGGAQMHPLWDGMSEADVARELDAAKAAGMDTIRADMGWSTLEAGGKGQYASYYVERADAFFAAAAARGLKVILTFFSTPCWASSAPADVKQGCAGAWWDRGVAAYPPVRAVDYADAAAWVARRWGRHLHAFEVWNEPNYTRFLRGPDPAAAYAGMLKAAYPKLKAARSSLPVLGGSLVYSDGAWLQDLYDRLGVKGSFDGIAYHPYHGGRDPDTVGTGSPKYSYQAGTEWLREIMVARGDAKADLWITEMGFPTCTPGSHSWCVTPERQAEYIADSYRIAREKWPYVRAVVTYRLRNPNTDPASFEGQMGLLWHDFAPKPAYGTLRAELTR